ncbi:hypothetical protein [Legionella sp. WA2024007413]
MSGKPLHVWRAKWNYLTHKNDNFDVIKKLLFEYSGSFSHTPLGQCYAWGGMFGRFFGGRWGTNHGNEVQKALGAIHNQTLGDTWCPVSGPQTESFTEQKDDLSIKVTIQDCYGITYEEQRKGEVIRTFFSSRIECDFSPSLEVKIKELLQQIKKNLGNKPIKPDGDLNRIFTVIGEKTGIQYSDIELKKDYAREERLERLPKLLEALEKEQSAPSNRPQMRLTKLHHSIDF